MDGKVLVVDDDCGCARGMARLLRAAGFTVEIAHSAREARERLDTGDYDVVLMDLLLPDGDGAGLVTELAPHHPATCFVMVTGHGSIPSTVDCMRRGALDYLTKPVPGPVLIKAVLTALEEARATGGRGCPATPARPEAPVSDATCRSAAMQRVMEMAGRVAATGAGVLLLGETGTGKDWLADWIHRHSRRHGGPFVPVNCAALPRDLAESQLFGHEAGTFTGARGPHHGFVGQARGGTLFLNEVGELEPALQAKLLAFLDGGCFQRLGGEKVLHADVRILAATNRDLSAEVENDRFRGDLFHRLQRVVIMLPPLRERIEDLPGLVDVVLGDLARELGLAGRPTVDPAAVKALLAFTWPGNIRELQNVLRQALLASTGCRIGATALHFAPSPEPWQFAVSFPEDRNLPGLLMDIERRLLGEAVRRGGSHAEAARLSGISRYALLRWLNRLGLPVRDPHG